MGETRIERYIGYMAEALDALGRATLHSPEDMTLDTARLRASARRLLESAQDRASE